MKRHLFPAFIYWWVENRKEYTALARAEDGDLSPLTELIESEGALATKEAREFVVARLRGDRQTVGQKRTISQQSKEIAILGMVIDIQKELNCSEHKARHVFLDRHPDICEKEDSLKTHLRRAKKSLEKFFGRPVTPVVQGTKPLRQHPKKGFCP